jgi:glucan phosphoethanolaminetransferase (alkaline phosphatase superfamily)
MNKLKLLLDTPINRIFIVLFFAFYIIFLYNSPLLTKQAINVFLSNTLSLFVALTTILYLFSFNKWVFVFVASFFNFVSLAGFYTYTHYNIELNFTIAAAIFNTNFNESKENLSLAIIPYFIVFFIAPLILMCLIRWKPIIKNFNIKKTLKTNTLLALFLIFCLTLGYFLSPRDVFYRKNKYIPHFNFFVPLNPNYIPVNVIQGFFKNILLRSGKHTYLDLTLDNKFSFANKAKEPLIVVLIIGESARAANFSINGYKRETNPLLSKIPNLVSFTDFTSCNTGTIASVTCLLSSQSGEKFRAKLQYNLATNIDSFIPIFNKLNFTSYFASTSSYRSADPIFYRFLQSKTINYLAKSKLAEHARDELIITSMKDILNDPIKDNKLVIFHTFGSHYKYVIRYAKEFEKFTPICSKTPNIELKDCKINEIVNEYDNTILYTDFVIAGVIDNLKDKNAILIYTSDHGESLGETPDAFYHGREFSTAPINEIHIPTIVWFSDKYIKNYGKDALNNALKNKNKPMNHDYIFNSILDCSMIYSNTNIIDKKLSFCK